jgi:hypothetical protein
MNPKLNTIRIPSSFKGFVTSSPLSIEEELEILRRIRVLANLLDNQIGIPGTNIRLGWDGLLGLIPGVGDLATGLLSAYIVRLGLSPSLAMYSTLPGSRI